MITRCLIVLSVAATLFSASRGLGHHTHVPQCRNCEKSETGSIKGQVIDKEGNPVSGITVYAELEKPDVILGEIPTETTDKAGEFILKGLYAGVYHIYAADEARGYPKLSALIYQSEYNRLLVSVQKNQETSVRVILGDKLGKLVGKVIDAKTGKVIGNAVVKVSLEGQADHSIERSVSQRGSFRILLPNAHCRIEISAAGYHPWGLKDWAPNKGKETITLASERSTTLTAALVPKQ